MAAPSKNKWLTISLLAIILPVTLLVTFKLTGVIPEPHTPETTTLEPACWNMSRPSDYVKIDKWIENSYDAGASVSLNVHILDYTEDDPGYPAYDNDIIRLRIVAVVNVSNGFVYSVVVRFSRTDALAVLKVPVSTVTGKLHPSMHLHNLKLESFQEYGTSEKEAYVRTISQNKPRECLLEILTYWIFPDEKYRQITVTLKGTYFEEGTYQEVTIPVVIGVLCDAGDTFDTARRMTCGEYTECIDDADVIDIYMISVQEGQTINITMMPPETANFDLFLYNPSRTLVANSTEPSGAIESLHYIADLAGDWYIKVERSGPGGQYGNGIYSLAIDIHE